MFLLLLFSGTEANNSEQIKIFCAADAESAPANDEHMQGTPCHEQIHTQHISWLRLRVEHYVY